MKFFIISLMVAVWLISSVSKEEGLSKFTNNCQIDHNQIAGELFGGAK